MVTLEKEIEFLRRLVSLHRMMLSEDDDVNVTFDVAGEADGLTVAPMLLSPQPPYTWLPAGAGGRDSRCGQP